MIKTVIKKSFRKILLKMRLNVYKDNGTLEENKIDLLEVLL